MSLDISFGDHSQNITHNVIRMWDYCGIGEDLYKSEGKSTTEITENIKNGLIKMIESKHVLEDMNASNGWGTYDQALPWLIRLYQALLDYPDEKIHISA